MIQKKIEVLGEAGLSETNFSKTAESTNYCPKVIDLKKYQWSLEEAEWALTGVHCDWQVDFTAMLYLVPQAMFCSSSQDP